MRPRLVGRDSVIRALDAADAELSEHCDRRLVMRFCETASWCEGVVPRATTLSATPHHDEH
jgi:hypothetical protein